MKKKLDTYRDELRSDCVARSLRLHVWAALGAFFVRVCRQCSGCGFRAVMLEGVTHTAIACICNEGFSLDLPVCLLTHTRPKAVPTPCSSSFLPLRSSSLKWSRTFCRMCAPHNFRVVSRYVLTNYYKLFIFIFKTSV